MGEDRNHSDRSSDVIVAGEPDFRLAIRVFAYEFPGSPEGSDADWLLGSLELRLGERVEARIENDPFLRGEELAWFREELGELLAGRSDNAELVTLEDMVTLEIQRAGERFTLAGAVTDHGSLDMDFDGVTIGAAGLERVITELDALLAKFPVRPESRVRAVLGRLPRPELRNFLTRRTR